MSLQLKAMKYYIYFTREGLVLLLLLPKNSSTTEDGGPPKQKNCPDSQKSCDFSCKCQKIVLIQKVWPRISRYYPKQVFCCVHSVNIFHQFCIYAIMAWQYVVATVQNLVLVLVALLEIIIILVLRFYSKRTQLKFIQS